MQTDAARRKMLVKMNIAPPVPDLQTLRAYCYIDDRVPPEGESDGEFSSHITWVNKAASWIGWTGAKCYDAQDRPCRNGGDMRRAHEEGAFPVRWYWPERFVQPIVPTKADQIAICRLSGEETTIDEFRNKDGIKRYKTERLRLFYDEHELTMTDKTVSLTPAGIERQAIWKYAILCAQCVRRP